MKHTKVLLVESDQSVRNLVAKAFERTRFDLCGCVRDVTGGVALCKQRSPQIVLISLSKFSGTDHKAVDAFKKALPKARLRLSSPSLGS